MAEEHHVAWADRIGLNKLWARDILACSEAFGMEWYPKTVKRFRNDIINIKNGPQLRTIIDKYADGKLEIKKKEMLQEWKMAFPQEAMNESYVLQKRDEIDQWVAEKLCNFMIQLLEDHGFCFYESTIEMDEMQ